ARLLDRNIGWLSAPGDVEREIDALGVRDARIDLILEPVFRDFLLHDFHVPRVATSKVPTTAGKPEASLGTARAESAIGTAHWPALAIGNCVAGLFRRRNRFLLGGACLGLGFLLRVFIRDGDRVGCFFLNLGERFCKAL